MQNIEVIRKEMIKYFEISISTYNERIQTPENFLELLLNYFQSVKGMYAQHIQAFETKRQKELLHKLKYVYINGEKGKNMRLFIKKQTGRI